MGLRVDSDCGVAMVYATIINTNDELSLQRLLGIPTAGYSHIAVMPNFKADEGCISGLTMTVSQSVIPELIGPDPGCGVLAVKLNTQELDITELDSAVKTTVLTGTYHNSFQQGWNKYIKEQINNLTCRNEIDLTKVLTTATSDVMDRSSHFIEVARSKADDMLWLIVHLGSGCIGQEVINYWKKQATFHRAVSSSPLFYGQLLALQHAGKEDEIKTLYNEVTGMELNEPAYMARDSISQFVADLNIVCEYADAARQAIISTIVDTLKIEVEDCISTAHNYISMSSSLEVPVLRKSAVSAEKGERLIIPLNMRDGSLLCQGKGNKDWNCSAPCGSGRFLSREEARVLLPADAIRTEMDQAGIYTSTASGLLALEESPEAYRDSRVLEDCIKETVEVQDRLIPVYNFKEGRWLWC